jgi:FG-GAP repeat
MESRCRSLGCAVIAGAAALGLLILAPSASAALPVAYDVQKVDSPNPTVGGDFGIAMVNAGDLNGDGKHDIVIGTDEHGGSTGTIFEISGADGSPIRTISAPDLDASNPPGNTLPSFGSYVGSLPDIGSCPGGASGVSCANPTIGGPDAVPDVLVTALGLDVGGLVDAGRAYIVDGLTGAILKRIDMPAADLAQQAGPPGGPKKPAFGRTILTPASPYGSQGFDPSAATQIGDMNGGGQPDIIVSASDYFETGATANSASPCFASPTNECLQAGRSYVYYGEEIVGTDPSAIENTPNMTIKNPAAQPDDPTSPVNANRENLGYSIEPVGDLGQCSTASPAPGIPCPNADSIGVSGGTGLADGRPDVAISSHRSDDFGMFDVGVVHLIDGDDGSVLYTYHHPEPQPASLFAFSNYNQPAPGNLGSSIAPDVYQAAMRQNNPFTGGGKAYAMNGAFKQSGSPNAISFATLVDPTPHPSEDFGTSSAGIGNVFGNPTTPNEMLVGAYGPHNPGTSTTVVNDVHIFDVANETELQNIPAPDQQSGSGFGTSLAPLGDLNGDGFLDFAVGAGLFDLQTTSGACSGGCADAGRVYIFRSNNTATLATPGTVTAQAGRSLDLDSSKSKVRKGKSFILSGTLRSPVNPGACQGGQTVTLERKKPGGSGFTPFASDTTDSSGGFRMKVKGKRTFLYMAHADPTTTCGGADSNTAKVKVRK